MRSFANNLRQILRRLGRAPMFTSVALITIAIGVGANTAVFSVIESVLLKPLPYPHPEQLVNVSHAALALGAKDFSSVAFNVFYLSRPGPRLSGYWTL